MIAVIVPAAILVASTVLFAFAFAVAVAMFVRQRRTRHKQY